MAETFEVGDRVRTTDRLEGYPAGSLGTIVEAKDGMFIRVELDDFPSEGRGRPYMPKELEHVTTTKGDIVAKATKTTREVTETRTITETVKVPTITLELSQEEAQTLADIFYKTGGHEERSRRRFTDRISNALSSVGVRPARYDRPSDITQGVWFEDDSR